MTVNDKPAAITQPKDKTSLLTKIAYGSGAGGGNVVSTILASFLLAYYTDTALIGAAAVSTMFFVLRIFDGVTDLIMGGVIDKTNTKWGKARPWLFVSAPLMGLGLVLVMNVPTDWDEGMKLVYAYITYAFLNVIAFTIFGIAHAALLARISLDSNERTNITVVSSFLNFLAGTIVGSIAIPLVMGLGWGTTAIILGIASAALVLVTAFFVPETVGVDAAGAMHLDNTPLRVSIPVVLKNKYFFLIMAVTAMVLIMNANAIASMIFYCNNVMGDPGFMTLLMSVGQLPGLVMLFIMPWFARRFSKQKFMLAGMALVIAGFFVCGIAGTDGTLVLIGVILRGLGTGPLFACVYAFLADVTDYGEWKSGVRTEGLIASASSFGAKVGIGIGSGVTGWVLAAGAYDGALGPDQPQSAIDAIKFSFSWLGLIITVVMAVITLFLNVEKFLPEIRAALDDKAALNDKGE
jgi:GPH family glycoside/pentoside/hexuronide:cation symporter